MLQQVDELILKVFEAVKKNDYFLSHMAMIYLDMFVLQAKNVKKWHKEAEQCNGSLRNMALSFEASHYVNAMHYGNRIIDYVNA